MMEMSSEPHQELLGVVVVALFTWMESPVEGSRSFNDTSRPSPTVPTVYARRLCHLIFKSSSKNRSRGFVTLPASTFDSEETPHTLLLA